LSEEKKQQVVSLEKLGWPLRRIEQATGVRRETAGAYLKAAGIAVRTPSRNPFFVLRSDWQRWFWTQSDPNRKTAQNRKRRKAFGFNK
jgi:hypothetical protein